MKKIFYIILLFTFTIIKTNAKTLFNYNETIHNANNYNNNVYLYDVFFIKNNNLPIVYDNSCIIKTSPQFINGGLLNEKEYDISIRNNETYLLTGSNYYTMNSGKCVLYNGLNNCETSSTYENMITELVKPMTKISGIGTYYEPWKFDIISVKVTLNTNGGNCNDIKSFTTYYGSTYKNLPESCTKLGYEFTGWIDNDGNEVLKTDVVTSDENRTFTATYKAVVYTVAFNCNGGSGNMDNQTIYYDISTPLSPNKCSKNGYVFNGWSTTTNGNPIYTNEQEVFQATVPPNTLTLYAQWKDAVAPTCSLTVSGNNVVFSSKSDNIGVTNYGLSTSTTQTYNSSTSIGISANTFYGYVKDAAGNTGNCSLNIKSTTKETYNTTVSCCTSNECCNVWYCEWGPWCCNGNGCPCANYGTCNETRTRYVCDSEYIKIDDSWCYK